MSGMTGGEFYWLWPKKKNVGGTGVFERKNYTGGTGVFERFEINQEKQVVVRSLVNVGQC